MTVGLAACSTPDVPEYSGKSIFQLAEFTSDGGSEIYEVQIEPVGPSFVTVSREYEEEYFDLGLSVRELDRESATELGLSPFSGLLIRAVDADSPLGGHVGDVLVAVEDTEVAYLETYDNLRRRLSTDREVRLKILAMASASSSAAKATPSNLRVRPLRRKRMARRLTRIPLETVGGTIPSHHAGFRLKVVPVSVSRRIYGDDRHAIVITGIALGSPAYLAGLRAGDIIERVDGRPTPAPNALLELLHERSAEEGEVVLDVVRGSGQSFAARVSLEDSSETFTLYIPAVCDVSASPRDTRWTVLPWGVLASFENSYLETEARTVEEYGEYSILLGCFRYRWRPEGTSFRLLWLIDF